MQETTQGRAAHLADDVLAPTPASDINPAAHSVVGFLFVRIRRRGAIWIRTYFVRFAGWFSESRRSRGAWRSWSTASGLSRWSGSAVSGASAMYPGQKNERRAKRSRWSCPFINKCNGCSHRSCSEPESAKEVRDDYSRALVAGADAGRRGSLQGCDGVADVWASRWLARKSHHGVFEDRASAPVEARLQVPVCVGRGTAGTWGRSLSHFDLVAEGAVLAKTRQEGLVASWLDWDSMGTECGGLFGEVCSEAGRHRHVAEGIADLRERRLGTVSAYGAALVAFAEMGEGNFRD